MNTIHRSHPSRQSGLTLIEVLVAIVVISFGLLGVAALQITGLKNNQSAFNRSTANNLAYDMLDRMRANKTELLAGSYDTKGAFWDFAHNAPSSTATMEDVDMTDWLQALAKRLPSGKGKIEAAASASVLRVTIQWDDTRGTAGSATTSLSVEAQGCGTDTATTCYF